MDGFPTGIGLIIAAAIIGVLIAGAIIVAAALVMGVLA